MDKYKTECELLGTCAFFRTYIGNNFKGCKKLVNTYCNGPLMDTCKRKEIKYSGTEPEEELLPNGEHLDDSKLACKYLKSCDLLKQLELIDKNEHMSIKKEYCRAEKQNECYRYKAKSGSTPISGSILPNGGVLTTKSKIKKLFSRIFSRK